MTPPDEPVGRTVDDPEIVARVLELLRKYGWETGHKVLEAELQEADAVGREARSFFLGWMAGERGDFATARTHLTALAQVPPLAGWALLGQGYVALREKAYPEVHRLLAAAEEQSDAHPVFRATAAPIRGTLLFHQGDADGALRLLLAAYRDFGREHFGTGRALDTLGMIYQDRQNFHAAQEFYHKAIEFKAKYGDQAGLALSHGQLGRLYLDWGLWHRAAWHFLEDLRICRRIGDERGQAQMFNHLGQLAQVRGELELAVGRPDAARRHWEAAAGWLEACIRRGGRHGWTVLEAYARKDRARVHLEEGQTDAAEAELRRAEELFRQGEREFVEGLAHINRAWGVLHRQCGRWEEAQAALRSALRHFIDTQEPVEEARTQFEIARTYRAAGEPRALVRQALREALCQAEACRRAYLVRQIEEELRAVDPEAHAEHVYQRVRGRAVMADTTSLMEGSREAATVLYLDLAGSTDFARGRDPEEVMLTLNEMMAALVGVLQRYEAPVSAFRGDGFLALVRGPDHAVRAVQAGLDLAAAMRGFNEPRRVLGLKELEVRIGIATGEVFLGNLGTYDKMSFTAIGTTANLGARLEAEAEPGLLCISRGTHDLVRDRFTFKEGNPRTKELKGLGMQEMWDVVERRER